MPSKSKTSKLSTNFNKHGLHLRWPRVWIIIIGLILLFLCFSIAGMEVGHTIYDFRRSTAFGGFIVFIPLFFCAVFVMITGCVPRLILLRIAVLLCGMAILLCMVLMAYDIIVLIDPTRCFFFNCNDATVTLSNSTVISGWPIYASWPDYFLTNMNAKRIFQSIQMLCAGLFILFSALFLLTYFIYRHIRVQQQNVDRMDNGTFTTYEKSPRTAMKYANNNPNNNNNNVMSSFSRPTPNNKVTTYVVTGSPNSYSPTKVEMSPRRTKAKTFVRPRANSLDNDRFCTRCNREPKVIITSNYERQNYFPNLCLNCNNDLANARRRPTLNQSKMNRAWRH